MNTHWSKYRFVYFLGIGGIGMSALARYFMAAGLQVAGYDRTSTTLTDELRREGMDIHFSDELDRIPAQMRDPRTKDETLVVLTPAIPANHNELVFFRKEKYGVMKRSEVLGFITSSAPTFAVAGTHGKTTTSSILAHLLIKARLNCTAFLGGIALNAGSNFIQGKPLEEGHCFVVEADEFDRSFLTLHPETAIITSMDPDHLDIYGNRGHMLESYRLFASQVKSGGTLIYKSGLDPGEVSCRTLTYSIAGDKADYAGSHISVRDGRYHFRLETPGYVIDGLSLGLPGRHNMENAVAACAAALESGIDPSSLKEGLETYRGVQRRFEVHLRGEVTYIDDYAHHPEEIKAALQSVKELFPGKRITGIFQPHLYSRTRDFASGFAESLEILDRLYLLDIYPAREEPIPGVTSSIIFDKVKLADKHLLDRETVVSAIRTERPEVLVTLGAGDIDQLVQPLKTLLST